MQNLYVDTKYMMQKSLNTMTGLLHKAQEQLKDKEHSEEALLEARLAPDMFPLVKQIQIMSDNAKGAMARLAGVEAPVMEDTEKTMAELVERMKKTAEFVSGIDDEELKKADDRKIILSYFPDKYQAAEDYTRDHAIPNFYFHFVTAYAILRMMGYEVGKQDYIGGLTLKDL